MNVNLKLLCTFAFRNNIDYIIDSISNQFDGVQKIFVFANKDNNKECYVTFNIDLALNQKFDKFIVIHRKKESNTLYSVNALNTIIRNMNNGILDTTYILNWQLYKNMLLLAKDNEVSRIPLELEEIVEF